MIKPAEDRYCYYFTWQIYAIVPIIIILILSSHSFAQPEPDIGPRFNEILGPKSQILSTTEVTAATDAVGAQAPKYARQTTDQAGGSSTQVYVNAMPSTEEPFSVSKKVLESSEDGYFVNRTIHIRVQITCTSKIPIERLLIWEHTDKDLEITNFKRYIRTNFINDTLSPENILNCECSINKNGTYFMEIKNMYPRENLIYEYGLKPQKPGVFYANTILRASNENAVYEYPDYTLPLELRAINEHPKFEILFGIEGLETYSNEPISFAPAIRLIEGSTADSRNIYKITYIKPVATQEVEITEQNHTINLSENTFKTINGSTITYYKAGTYKLPYVVINNTYFYQAEDNIVVKDHTQEILITIIIPLIAGLAAIIAIFKEILLERKMDKLTERIDGIEKGQFNSKTHPEQDVGLQSKSFFCLGSTDSTSAKRQKTAKDFLDEGVALYKQGRYDEAIKAHEEAIRLNPNYVDVWYWYNKSYALKSLGRTAEADASFVKEKERENSR